MDAQARGACHLWERQKMLFFWAIAILGGSKRRFRQTVVVVGSNERRFHQSLVIARDIRRRYHSYMTIATRNQKMYERKAFACSSRGTALCQPPYRRIGMALFTNALWQRGRTPVLRSLGTVFDSSRERRTILPSTNSPSLWQCIWSYGRPLLWWRRHSVI